MLSRSLGQDPDTTTYMEVLPGSEVCPCEAFQRETDEDLIVRERFLIRTEIPSVREPGTNGNHALIGQAQNDILVLIAKKYRSQWTMYVQRGLKTNILHLQMEKI